MKKIILSFLMTVLAISTFAGCGEKNQTTILESEASKTADETHEGTSMKLINDLLTIECGEPISSDITKYISVKNEADYNNIEMYYLSTRVEQDIVIDIPSEGKIQFKNTVTNETLELPYTVKDTIDPVVKSYIGSYQFYLRNSDNTPKDSYTLDAAKIQITDFQIEYEDATSCTLSFTNTDSDIFNDYLTINFLSEDYKAGTYRNEIVITDLGGNEVKLPVTIELLDEPEPGDNFASCICSDKCNPESPYTSCTVCSTDPSQCIGVEPEITVE
ncbi:hypothetical protein CE91St56_22930 [Lachnospiraceae bacterium]|nr:hypothetical protein CE91St56_22930 [Lachnospiraceae bacterium]GKH41237.1 hypothetical protein CE91St57_22110 [Lachnospiraceae bacterium]